MINKNLILTSRILLFGAGILGVALQLIKNGGFGMLLYYTVLSNILTTAFAGYLVYLMITKKDYTSQNLLRLKGGVVMSIMITFVIYHFMLRPFIFPENFYRIENFLCHYIVPLWFFFDTLVFDKRNQYKKFDPIYWAAAPLIYTILALFNGLVTKIAIPGSPDSPFAYFFLNVPKQGWTQTLISIATISTSYIILGYVFFAIMKIRLKRK